MKAINELICKYFGHRYKPAEHKEIPCSIPGRRYQYEECERCNNPRISMEPPYTKAEVERMATVGLIMILAIAARADIPTTPQPITLAWNYSGGKVDAFKIYSSTNMANWSLLTTTTNQSVSILATPAACFYFVTASNFWGESGPSNIASTPDPVNQPTDESITRTIPTPHARPSTPIYVPANPVNPGGIRTNPVIDVNVQTGEHYRAPSVTIDPRLSGPESDPGPARPGTSR